MCDCRGKYSYASEFQASESIRRGYEVSADEVSDRSIKLITNKLVKLLETGAAEQVYVAEDWISVDVGNRNYTVYFREPAKV